MKKFGFGKSKDDDEDSRNALFSSKKSKAPSTSSNPYAAAPANPYAAAPAGSDPYLNSHPAPPAYSSSGNPSQSSFRQEKSPVPVGGYGGSSTGYGGASANQQGRYGAAPGAGGAGAGGYGGSSSGSYGGGNGYGAGGQNPYGGGGEPVSQTTSRYGSGGYGGFGQQNESDDAARGELFGNAPQRLAQHQQQPQQPGQGYGQSAPPPAPGTWESGTGANYGQQPGNGYGAYADRQLTAEEQEEEDIQASKQEIRFIKQQDVASTRNALRIAAQAEETGRATLERLGQQGERIHNTERNLDLASNQNRLAAEKARELKTLNRSMWAVHMSNPFTSNKRIQEREQAVLDQARADRDTRDATRHEAWSSGQRGNMTAKEMARAGGIQQKTKASLAERSKYQFEADSEDEAMEEELDNNLDLLHGAAKRLNGLAGAMGREVDSQNTHITRIGGKVDRVDDEIALNRSRLDNIR